MLDIRYGLDGVSQKNKRGCTKVLQFKMVWEILCTLFKTVDNRFWCEKKKKMKKKIDVHLGSTSMASPNILVWGKIHGNFEYTRFFYVMVTHKS